MSLLDEIDKCMTKMTEHKNAARHLMQMALEERNQSSTWEKRGEELLKQLETLEAEGKTDE
jgi:hypothetical protein|nr:MAG TPA: hypothetical protein [Caudoviricetes sp.]DAU72766.1 MAG TPA: hypothetical protein [Caudoviricetes sp.]